jgi:hypothetical protein
MLAEFVVHLVSEKRARIPMALGIFFIVAALICCVAAFTLLFPETPLSAIWRIKPDAFTQLLQFSPWTGIGFLLLSGAMAATAWGCLHRHRWGWRMALAIFVANGAGDLVQLFAGRVVEGAIGIVVVVTLVLCLTRPEVKSIFK